MSGSVQSVAGSGPAQPPPPATAASTPAASATPTATATAAATGATTSGGSGSSSIPRWRLTSVSESYMQKQYSRKREHVPFDVEAWQPLIAAFTFPTFYLPLSPVEAEAILHSYHERYHKRASLTAIDIAALYGLESRVQAVFEKYPELKTGSFVRLSSRSAKDGIPLSGQSLYSCYLQTLHELVHATGDPNANANAPAYKPGVDTASGVANGNQKMVAACRATSKFARVASGAEVMSFFMSSDRVFRDLMLALECMRGGEFDTTNATATASAPTKPAPASAAPTPATASPATGAATAAATATAAAPPATAASSGSAAVASGDGEVVYKPTDVIPGTSLRLCDWSTAISFRKWESDLDDSYEFRCFVSGGRLRAISQYNHYCVYPHLFGQKDAIQACISALIARVHPLIAKLYDTYVIDIAILKPATATATAATASAATGTDQKSSAAGGGGGGGELRGLVIELNPFAPTTGASLFDWNADRVQLTAASEVEFRIRKEPPPNLNEFFEAGILPQLLQVNSYDQIRYDEVWTAADYRVRKINPKQRPSATSGCAVQ